MGNRFIVPERGLVGGFNFLNTSSGTALTGATTITVSNLPDIDELAIIIQNASSASANSTFLMRFNSDSGNNYPSAGYYEYGSTSYFQTYNGAGGNAIQLGDLGQSAGDTFNAFCFVRGCRSSGRKIFESNSTPSGTGRVRYTLGGYYNSTNKITSVSIISGTGNFDSGTVYLLGA